MTCTLVACTGEVSRGVVGILTDCIVGFFFPVGSLGGSMRVLFCRGAHFWSSDRKYYEGH